MHTLPYNYNYVLKYMNSCMFQASLPHHQGVYSCIILSLVLIMISNIWKGRRCSIAWVILLDYEKVIKLRAEPIICIYIYTLYVFVRVCVCIQYTHTHTHIYIYNDEFCCLCCPLCRLLDITTYQPPDMTVFKERDISTELSNKKHVKNFVTKLSRKTIIKTGEYFFD